MGYYSGSVQVLERAESAWNLVQEPVTPRDPLDRFGDSVALFGNTALIAAPG